MCRFLMTFETLACAFAPPINVGDDSWICADAFVGPNVSVGEGAVVGARAVAVRDVSAMDYCCGNPAKQIGIRTLNYSPES